MSEMIERVARAIIEVESSVFSGETPAEHYRNCARAAIEAMRDPTDDMYRSGELAQAVHPVRAECIWVTMIDEALK